MPHRVYILLAAIAPGLFWMRYIYKRDKFQPEPKKLILKCFLLGMLIVIPAGIIEVGIDNIIPSVFFGLVIVAPIVEELLKYFAMKKGISRHKAFDEPIDGMIYAAAIGLGFATLENIFYVRDAWQQGMFGSVAIIRGLLTIPGHAIFAAMWGYAVSAQKFYPSIRKKHVVFWGLVLGILLHAGLNFLTRVEIWGALGMVVLATIMWILFFRRIKKSRTAKITAPIQIHEDIEKTSTP